jgi:hypothetical protein
MRIGVAFPHGIVGDDPFAIRDWAQAVEDIGFDHVAIYEHVIGPDPARHAGRASATPIGRSGTSHLLCARSSPASPTVSDCRRL